MARRAWGDVAPALAGLTDRALFGEVGERSGLSKRDRGLVAVAAPVAGYRHTEPPGHARRALANGVTRGELVGLTTHLAFYAGPPPTPPCRSSAPCSVKRTRADRVFRPGDPDGADAQGPCSASPIARRRGDLSSDLWTLSVA